MMLPIWAGSVRARCERTAVQRCWVTFDENAAFRSVMPVLSVGVRWGRAIGWVCKSEAAGSNPARSISRKIYLQDFPRLGFHHRQQRCERGASGPQRAVAPSQVTESGAFVDRSRVTSSSGAGLTRRRSRESSPVVPVETSCKLASVRGQTQLSAAEKPETPSFSGVGVGLRSSPSRG
jgi:hypothetical protein